MQENDFKNRHDSNRQTILSLKKEADDLRFHLNEKSRHNNDIHNELSANRDQINRKEVDITTTQRDLSSKSDHSYALRKDIDNLSYEAAKLREEKAKDQDELLRLRELNNYRERENGEQQQRVRAVDYDLAKA
jgi:chromosome segregation ATPase